MNNEIRHKLLQKKYFREFDWRKNKDVFDFLTKSIFGDIPIFLSLHSKGVQVFVASLLLPMDSFTDYIEELKSDPSEWAINMTSGYSYGYGFDGKDAFDPKLYPPYDGETYAILSGAIPIFTFRTNPLEKNDSSYLELNQQISHPHDLHYVDRFKSYIRLNELGDPDEIVKIVKTDNGDLVTFNEEVLNFHCHLGKYTHIRFFDFSRKFSQTEVDFFKDSHELWNNNFMGGKTGEDYDYTWLRGFQILPNTMSKDRFMDILLGRRRREYASFLIQDWRNKRLVEWSSDPKELGNYFVKSDLPFEISPAFFKKEVLKKYKDDPDKYEISHSRIECRGTWGLPYSINDANQVCVFIKDLSYLPFKEQLHWKQYNEKPEAPLSETTIKRAFHGEWVDDEDPLLDLMTELRNDILINSTVIWKTPTQREIEQITYLTSDNQKEWESDFLILNKVIVECFSKSRIKKLVRDTVSLEQQQSDIRGYGSLKLLHLVLSELSEQYETTELIMKPLFEVNDIRRIISSHRKGKEARERIQDIRKVYGTFIEHQKSIIAQLLTCFRLLRQFSQMKT